MASQAASFDCIVLGVGGVGSAALWQAAERGWRVLGLEQYGPAHDRGSSHGQTRIIRRAYFEHPSYVPLADEAFAAWDRLNRRYRSSIDRKPLLETCGLLQMGPPASQVIAGVRASAAAHQLEVETWTAAEIESRYPLFRVPADWVGLFEPGAGFLRVELGVAAALAQARVHGAEFRTGERVLGWRIEDSGDVVVTTDGGEYRAARLIITSGAWTAGLLPQLGECLQVVQQQQHWFQLDRVDQKHLNGFPAFLVEQENGDCFYGLPEIDYLGMKVCEHTGGIPLESVQQRRPGLQPEMLQRTESFMRRYLQFGHHRLVHHSNCFYTMSPDGHFIVDTHPEYEQVVLAAGLSGHGFKFAPVLGKALVDLLEGQRPSTLEAFALSRLLK